MRIWLVRTKEIASVRLRGKVFLCLYSGLKLSLRKRNGPEKGHGEDVAPDVVFGSNPVMSALEG